MMMMMRRRRRRTRRTHDLEVDLGSRLIFLYEKTLIQTFGFFSNTSMGIVGYYITHQNICGEFKHSRP
jgi:hypothetical protein